MNASNTDEYSNFLGWVECYYMNEKSKIATDWRAIIAKGRKEKEGKEE